MPWNHETRHTCSTMGRGELQTKHATLGRHAKCSPIASDFPVAKKEAIVWRSLSVASSCKASKNAAVDFLSRFKDWHLIDRFHLIPRSECRTTISESQHINARNVNAVHFASVGSVSHVSHVLNARISRIYDALAPGHHLLQTIHLTTAWDSILLTSWRVNQITTMMSWWMFHSGDWHHFLLTVLDSQFWSRSFSSILFQGCLGFQL